MVKRGDARKPPVSSTYKALQGLMEGEEQLDTVQGQRKGGRENSLPSRWGGDLKRSRWWRPRDTRARGSVQPPDRVAWAVGAGERNGGSRQRSGGRLSVARAGPCLVAVGAGGTRLCRARGAGGPPGVLTSEARREADRSAWDKQKGDGSEREWRCTQCASSTTSRRVEEAHEGGSFNQDRKDERRRDSDKTLPCELERTSGFTGLCRRGSSGGPGACSRRRSRSRHTSSELFGYREGLAHGRPAGSSPRLSVWDSGSVRFARKPYLCRGVPEVHSGPSDPQ